MQENLSHALQIDYRLLSERLKAKTIYSFASKGPVVQNGKFVWTGYLTVRIHDSANDATSLHAAGLPTCAQQRCRNFIGWRKPIGRFACSINALEPLRRSIRIRAVFRNVEKRFVEVEGSLVEATKFEVLHWAVGRVDNLTRSHEVEFSAFHFKVLSILLKEQGFEGRGLITILRSLIHGSPFSSSPSSWLAGE